MKSKCIILVCLLCLIFCVGCSSSEDAKRVDKDSLDTTTEGVTSTPIATLTPTPEPEPEIEFIGMNLHDAIVLLNELGIDKSMITYETDKAKPIFATSNWEIVDISIVKDCLHFVCSREAYINPLRGAAKKAIDVISSEKFNTVMDKLSKIKDRVETFEFVVNLIPGLKKK